MNTPSSTTRRRLTAALVTVPLAGAVGLARAQGWPTRPIHIISPSAPGGSADIVARLLADRMAKSLKVPVIVENRPGGTGSIALDHLAKSAPDGYTIAIGFAGANVIYPQLNRKLSFDALRDFTPIGQMASTGNVLVVHPSVPVRTLPEFIAYVKAQPKPPAYGSWGNGSGGHLAGEYLKMLTGINMFHVPYRSASALTTDMLGGHMPLAFLDVSNARPQIEAGKLIGIAQTGDARTEALKGLPLMTEQGVNFGVGIWFGLFGPAGLPRPIVERLYSEMREALLAPDLAERWVAVFGTRPAPVPSEAFEKTIRADWDLWKQVIERGKISIE